MLIAQFLGGSRARKGRSSGITFCKTDFILVMGVTINTFGQTHPGSNGVFFNLLLTCLTFLVQVHRWLEGGEVNAK